MKHKKKPVVEGNQLVLLKLTSYTLLDQFYYLCVGVLESLE